MGLRPNLLFPVEHPSHLRIINLTFSSLLSPNIIVNKPNFFLKYWPDIGKSNFDEQNGENLLPVT